jgi:phosphatidylglycerol:prolipoprotein diacylglycerol transferase
LFQPLPKRDGIVFCSAIILYAISRFLLEQIRSDEAGQWGTSLSIAQCIALATGFVALLTLGYRLRGPAQREWNWQLTR